MSAQPSQTPVCAVVGVGPGNGAAFARRFAAEGHAVALLARSSGLTSGLARELPLARAYACDVGDLAAVERTFQSIESDLGSVDVLIYNAGKGVWGSAEEVTFEDFEAAWRTNTFGAFAAARGVIPAMKRRGVGHIIFIGATASRRGGAKTAAFASAKAAQRSLAESLARSLGPSGIHVSLIIIDGIVDEPSIRTKLADKLDSFFVKPDDVADTAVMLTRQKPSAWTFELEARPFGETW
jgi:NAD(P)-dependent dehydrogenase (short-subunit alcohol dehydrogenase family)